MAEWLVDRLVAWQTGWWTDWLVDRMAEVLYCLMNILSGEQTFWLTECLLARLSGV